MRRGWYLKCKVCGAYRKSGVDILKPCPNCKQVTSWERAFEVFYVSKSENLEGFRKKADQAKAN